ncbi:hypothetical protein ZWY2020_014323 [Hordeum vulgare]|nr:hypothetical protein ZWY2020_014323 [Hordeum vulgare]
MVKWDAHARRSVLRLPSYHGRDTPVEELGKVVDCIDRSNAQLGTVVKLLVDRTAFTESFREAARGILNDVRGVVKMPYCNCLMDLCVNMGQMEKACALLDAVLQLGIYRLQQCADEDADAVIAAPQRLLGRRRSASLLSISPPLPPSSLLPRGPSRHGQNPRREMR